MKTSNQYEGKQSLGELWQSMEKLSQHVVEDNAKSTDYPLSVRTHQLASMKALISEIERHHVSETPQ